MREIEFRAYIKDTFLQGMVEVKEIDLKYKIVKFENGNKDELRTFDQIKLMQYTGLKDKNGKKIFEGDVVKCHYEDYYEAWDFIRIVGYIEGTFGLEDSKKKTFLAFINKSAYIRQFEVIGNIYDNPELLKGE